MRRGDIDVEDEVWVGKALFQILVEEGLDAGEKSVTHGEEKVEVIEVALADGEEGAVADEAAKFEGRIEVGDGFAEDEVVGYYCGFGVGMGYGSGSRYV